MSLSQFIYAPKIPLTFHILKIILFKLLHGNLERNVDVAYIFEALSKNRVNFHPYFSLSKYLSTGLEGSIMWTYQHYINIGLL